MSGLKALLRLLGWAAGPQYPAPERDDRMCVCRRCGADTVVPVRWEEEGDLHWWMRLRCGSCQASRDIVIDDDDADDFGRELDRHAERIAQTLEELERERMMDELRALEVALARDLIDAGDFER